MKPPAFQLYADDFIAGTLDMDDAEVGLYIRLLCIQWSKGSIPAAIDELMRFSRGSTTLQAERVKKKFHLCEDGELRNLRLEAVREDQQEWRRKSSEGGKKSAEARRNAKGGSRVVEPPHPLPLQPNVNTPVSSLQSPNNTKEEQVEIQIPDPLDIPKELHSPEFSASWQRWMTFRRGIGKKPKHWAVMFSEQLRWLKQFGPKEASEIIGQSIRNNYQGLFERKNNGSNQSINKPGADRNEGTANAGKASQYRGVGKVGWVPNSGNT